jgi:low affinity Fe/Cu permease
MTIAYESEGLMLQKSFAKFATKTSDAVGSPWAWIAACALIVGWAVTGPLFGFSDTWELVINTMTTIVTFLMVFLIQNTQNRDAKALHLKLDELLCAVSDADDGMIDIESLDPDRLAELAQHYSKKKAEVEALHAERIGRKSPTDDAAADRLRRRAHAKRRTHVDSSLH